MAPLSLDEIAIGAAAEPAMEQLDAMARAVRQQIVAIRAASRAYIAARSDPSNNDKADAFRAALYRATVAESATLATALQQTGAAAEGFATLAQVALDGWEPTTNEEDPT